MRPIRFFIITLLLLSPFFSSFAQNTPAELSVKLESVSSTEKLLQDLSQSRRDTNRINLLIKISHIYWRNKTIDNHAVDSCFLYAKIANDAARATHYDKGSNEAAFMMCKVFTHNDNVSAAQKLASTVFGEERVRLLLTIAEHYVFDFNTNQKEFEEAFPLITSARKICMDIHSDQWLRECQILLGKYYFKKGDFANGKKAIMEIIDALHKVQNYAQEARYWSVLGNTMPENDHTYQDLIYAQEQAVHYYIRANEKEKTAYAIRDLAILNGNHHHLDSAEKQLLRTVSIIKSINKKVSSTTYRMLADVYRATGQYDKALLYGYESLRTPEPDEAKRMLTYIVLARIYRQLSDYQNSLKYYRIVLNFEVARDKPIMFLSGFDMASTLVDSGDPKSALSFLTSFIRAHPVKHLNVRQLYASVFGDIYNKIGDYSRAEKYYLEMLHLNEQVEEENGTNLNKFHTSLSGSGAFFKIGKFYIERKRFKDGGYFLKKSMENPQYIEAAETADTFHLLFQADSALGKYLPAINYYQRYKLMNDSINSVARNRLVSELNIKYETEQRQKEIKAFQNRDLVQQAKLQRSETVRNFILGGAVALLLLALLAYNGYYNKQRSNRELRTQKQKINVQYNVLENLLAEKDNFLKEKDWLLKEVHHRVKNNLQIVMSLLSTQSAYLQNDDAIEAILESENRVQSIALIHQKLYSSDNLASIDMSEYISELVNHLSDGFGTEMRGIEFRQLIEKIKVDLSQAVPLGLILNEAITNSIKYAFESTGGEISIIFRRAEDSKVALIVADNGKGLPENFNILEANSLGMEMMQGLGRQLKGELRVTNIAGTSIMIEFPLAQSLSDKFPLN